MLATVRSATGWSGTEREAEKMEGEATEREERGRKGRDGARAVQVSDE